MFYLKRFFYKSFLGFRTSIENIHSWSEISIRQYYRLPQVIAAKEDKTMAKKVISWNTAIIVMALAAVILMSGALAFRSVAPLDPSKLNFGDGSRFWGLSRNARCKGGLSRIWVMPTAFQMPVYPAILSGIRLVWHAIIFQAVLLFAASGLVFKTVRELGYGKKRAWLAALLILGCPGVANYVFIIRPEILQIFLVSLAVYAWVKLREKPAWVVGSVSGIVFGTLVLTKTSSVLLIPAFLVAAFLNGRRKAAAFSLAVASLMYIPWGVRNINLGFPFQGSNGQFNLWVGNAPGIDYSNETRIRFWESVSPSGFLEDSSIVEHAKVLEDAGDERVACANFEKLGWEYFKRYRLASPERFAFVTGSNLLALIRTPNEVFVPWIAWTYAGSKEYLMEFVWPMRWLVVGFEILVVWFIVSGLFFPGPFRLSALVVAGFLFFPTASIFFLIPSHIFPFLPIAFVAGTTADPSPRLPRTKIITLSLLVIIITIARNLRLPYL